MSLTDEAFISLTAAHTFRIYCSGSDGPVLFLLHGGGHSALSWAVFTVSISTVTEEPHTLNSPLPSRLLFFSITEYFNLTRLLKCLPCGLWLQAVICSRINCRVVAMDLRAHGEHFPQLCQFWTRNSCFIFIKHLQFVTVVIFKSALKAFKLWCHATALSYVTPNWKVCFLPLWQATPEWKTKTISQQTQWPSEFLYALLTYTLHIAHTNNGSFANQDPCLW